MKKSVYLFDIFGSCTTRDCFSIKEAESYQVGEYIARQSILSVFSPPVKWIESDIKGLPSKFQRKVLVNDFEKTTFQKFSQGHGDYIILDFIDERFDIVKLESSYLTCSSELISSHYLDNKKYQVIPKGKWFCSGMDGYAQDCLDKFGAELLQIYNKNHIILHKAKMCNQYVGADKKIHSFPKHIISHNEVINNILDMLYQYIQQKINISHIIEISDCIACEDHKWGLAPMHYEGNYYVKVIDRLKEIIKYDEMQYEADKIQKIKKLEHQIDWKFEEKYSFFSTIRTSYIIEDTVYNNEAICDCFLGGNIILSAKKTSISNFSFKDIMSNSATGLNENARLQLFGLGIVYNLLLELEKGNPGYQWAMEKWINSYLAYAGHDFQLIYKYDYAVYDRIFSLIRYVSYNNCDIYTKHTVILYLYKEMQYLRSIFSYTGINAGLRAANAELMLSLFFHQISEIKNLIEKMLNLLYKGIINDKGEVLCSPAKCVSYFRYIKQFRDILQCVQISDTQLDILIGSLEHYLSVLTDLTGNIPAINLDNEAASPFINNSNYCSYTSHDIAVYKNDILYFLLYSKQENAQRHADMGQILLQAYGRRILIDCGSMFNTLRYHSCSYFSAYEETPPKELCSAMGSSILNVKCSSDAFQIEQTQEWSIGKILRSVQWLTKEKPELTITDHFISIEKKEVAARYILDEKCKNFHIDENKILCENQGLKILITVSPSKILISLEKFFVNKKSYMAIVCKGKLPVDINVCFSFFAEEIGRRKRLETEFLSKPFYRQLEQTMSQNLTASLARLESYGAVEIYRYGREAYSSGDFETAKKCEYLNQLVHNCFIKSTCSIGEGTRIAYGGIGVLIHKDSKIGRFCNIGTNVTIASASCTEDYVYIATGSRIVGKKITIGSFSIIGANAVVTDNIPPYSVVAGIPGKIINRITPENLDKYLESYLASVDKNNPAFVNKVRTEFLKSYKDNK